jgi:integrase
MNATTTELRKLQEAIADGRAPALPEGKADEFYWHPNIGGFGLRVYANGAGTWLVQYRTERGLQRRHKIGSAAALPLSVATNAAKRIMGDIARGIDPQGEREDARDKPKCTLGAMGKRFIEARTGPQPADPVLLPERAEKSSCRLAAMQVDEIEPRHVADKVQEIAKKSPDVAGHVRSYISSIYRWGKRTGVITVPNPVQDTWKPETPERNVRALSLQELGAVWRAAEAMAATPARYGGNAWGAKAPTPANSILAGTVVLSTIEAARQSGLGKSVLYRAIEAGTIKAKVRGDFRDDDLPQKKLRQGQGHRRDYMIEVAELEWFTAERSHAMRSPQADYSVIVRLLILLGGRYLEMGALRWSELDLDKGVLHIKGRRTAERRGTKNKRDLRLPLSPMAIAILKEIKPRPGRDFVFGDGPNGLVNNSRLKDELDARIAEMEGRPLPAWRHHDLRHSLSTNMNDKGIDPRVVETIVNHHSGHRKGIAGRYNHATYDLPVKQALQWWEQQIRNAADRLVEVEAPNVFAFGKPAQSA